MGAVLNHWINYSVWICTAAALLSDRRDTRPEWALQWERLGTTRLSLRLWGTQIFYHSGPWTLAENAYFCPGAGTAQSLAGTVTEAGKEPRAHGTVRVRVRVRVRSVPAQGLRKGAGLCKAEASVRGCVCTSAAHAEWSERHDSIFLWDLQFFWAHSIICQ